MADVTVESEHIVEIYAQALLQVGDRLNQTDALVAELVQVGDLVAKHPQFETLLTSPMVTVHERRASLRRIFEGRASRPILGLLLTLCEHDRLDLIPGVATAVKRRRDAAMGRKAVRITSAVPLAPDEQLAVVRRLADALALEPIPDFDVDPTLIGGLVVRVDDTVIDGSVRSRLGRLRQHIVARGRHEIQSR